MTVLYLWPKDTAKFEKYYPTHLKIVGDHQQEIGFTKAELTRFVSFTAGHEARVLPPGRALLPVDGGAEGRHRDGGVQGGRR